MRGQRAPGAAVAWTGDPAMPGRSRARGEAKTMSDRPLRIALVAHDAKKGALVEWAQAWREALSRHRLCGTGTSAGEVMEACPGLHVEELLSGPKGGDLQVGARIAARELDALVFFPDPESPTRTRTTCRRSSGSRCWPTSPWP